MPWEVTISLPHDAPLGDRDSVVKRISTALPSITWIEEPPLLERIKGMPDHPFHALISTLPEETRASFSRAKLLAELDLDNLSIQLYGFETQPIASINVEVRGTGNPIPALAALCFRTVGSPSIVRTERGSILPRKPRMDGRHSARAVTVRSAISGKHWMMSAPSHAVESPRAPDVPEVIEVRRLTRSLGSVV
jgi:hypothetical protein